jgi:hypothetical protein
MKPEESSAMSVRGVAAATVMDILSENSKKEYPESVTELLRLEEKKICARCLLLHRQNSYIYLKRKRSVCTKY